MIQILIVFCSDSRLSLIIDNFHSLVDKYNATSSITFDSVKKFAEQFVSNLYIKALIQGNVTKEHAIDVVNNFVSTLNCKPIDPNSYPKVSLLRCGFKSVVDFALSSEFVKYPKGRASACWNHLTQTIPTQL
jgi:secreted Zn-dependent insulinase-like peptidase